VRSAGAFVARCGSVVCFEFADGLFVSPDADLFLSARRPTIERLSVDAVAGVLAALSLADGVCCAGSRVISRRESSLDCRENRELLGVLSTVGGVSCAAGLCDAAGGVIVPGTLDVPPGSNDGSLDLDVVSRRAVIRSTRDLRAILLLPDDSGEDGCGVARLPVVGPPISVPMLPMPPKPDVPGWLDLENTLGDAADCRWLKTFPGLCRLGEADPMLKSREGWRLGAVIDGPEGLLGIDLPGLTDGLERIVAGGLLGLIDGLDGDIADDLPRLEDGLEGEMVGDLLGLNDGLGLRDGPGLGLGLMDARLSAIWFTIAPLSEPARPAPRACKRIGDRKLASEKPA
jgi:hypothetical protein